MINSNSLISVIVAVYNAEEWLNRCVDSILAQTYTNIEIILVDDGSTDSSPHICDEYAMKDQRVRVIHKPNGGLADARNVGISDARGDYIGFIDNDDYIASDMYEVLLNAIIDNDVQMVVCDYTYVDEQGREIKEEISPIRKTEVITAEEYLRRLAKPQSGYYITVWNRLYKKEVLNGVIFPKGRTNEDSYVVHRIVCNCNKILVLCKKFIFYTQRESSLSRTPKAYQFFDLIEALIDRIRFYEKEDYNELIPEATDELVKLFLQVRRRFIFRGKKTFAGLKRAAEIKKKAITMAGDIAQIDNKTVRTLYFSDFIIVKQILRERMGSRHKQ